MVIYLILVYISDIALTKNGFHIAAFEPVVYALAPVSGVLLIALCVAMVLLCKKNRV